MQQDATHPGDLLDSALDVEALSSEGRKRLLLASEQASAHRNVRDLEEIDQTVRAALRFIPVETVDQVFAAALCPERDPVREEVADHVAAFAPAGRETGRDAVRQ